MHTRTLAPDNFLLNLTPLLLLVTIQVWILYLSHSPTRTLNFSQYFTFLNQNTTSPTPASQHTLESLLNQPKPTTEELQRMFEAYGNYYEVEPNILRHISFCESRFNPSATNGKHAGLYQFNSTTWSANRKRMNLDPDPNLRFHPEEAIKTAAFMIHNGGINAWAYCSRSVVSRS